MISLQVQGDDTIVADFEQYSGHVTRAMVRALNRGMASGRTVMVRSVAADTGLKSSDVRDAMPLTQATASRLEARLAASLKRIPLIKFGARQTRTGVTYRLGKSGRTSIPHAFIARMRSGHEGVFTRVAPSRSRKGMRSPSPQLPIQEKFGPSLGHVFAKYRTVTIARIVEATAQNLDHELQFAKTEAADAGTD